MAFDEDRNVVVLFGGFDVEYDDETWEWDGTAGTWTQRITTVQPSPRAGHSMAYDGARGVTVLYGGGAGDTWEWNGLAGTWTLATPSAPQPAGPSPAQEPLPDPAGDASNARMGARSTGRSAVAHTSVASVSGTRVCELHDAGPGSRSVGGGSRGGAELETAAGARLFFLDHGESSGHSLFCMPVDASQNPVLLSARTHDVLDFELSPDGTLVVYRAGPERPTLHVVPADGSAGPLELAASSERARGIVDYRIAPSSDRLVFVVQAGRGAFELYCISLAGNEPALKLSISGAWFVYRLDEAGDVRFNLYGSRADGRGALLPLR